MTRQQKDSKLELESWDLTKEQGWVGSHCYKDFPFNWRVMLMYEVLKKYIFYMSFPTPNSHFLPRLTQQPPTVLVSSPVLL